MTKIVLFPFAGVTIAEALHACELTPEQSGFLTGSTFLPWRSVVIAGDVYTEFEELFEETCGCLPLQFTENFNDGCGSLNLQHEEGWES